MPIEPATNPVWTQALKVLDEKPETDRSEFERQFFARLTELMTLIDRGNQSIDRYTEILETAKEQTLKACGAYENTADMLAVYYVTQQQKASEELSEDLEDLEEKVSLVDEVSKKMKNILGKAAVGDVPIKVQAEVKPERTS